MRYTHVRRIDLGLLATLQALVEERSITRAAERMSLSQPAMSRAFDRLQAMFGDELLVRTGQGYEPTHRALNLYAELDHLLPRLDALLRGNQFKAATAADNFRIAATDFAASVLFPALMARLAAEAPNVSLEIIPWDDDTFQRLETNALDLALWVNRAPKGFLTEVLFEDVFMCLVRKDHPASKKPLTLERYLAYPHALVSLTRHRQGVIDKALEDKGIERKVQLITPYFASAAWIIERSDMILTVPKMLAERLAKISKTRMLKPPLELAGFQYIQVWHPRVDGDPAHQWLRKTMAEISVAVP
jgi:DNA-binding transcriptional LysR family regulator